MIDQKLAALKATSLFSTCTDKQLELIGKMTDRTKVPAGRVLVHEDSVPTHMMILITGKAVVATDGIQLAELGPGDVVGELSLVDSRLASASVTATEDSTIWLIAHNVFKPVWDENPDISTSLLQAVVARLRDTNELAT